MGDVPFGMGGSLDSDESSLKELKAFALVRTNLGASRINGSRRESLMNEIFAFSFYILCDIFMV